MAFGIHEHVDEIQGSSKLLDQTLQQLIPCNIIRNTAQHRRPRTTLKGSAEEAEEFNAEVQVLDTPNKIKACCCPTRWTASQCKMQTRSIRSTSASWS